MHKLTFRYRLFALIFVLGLTAVVLPHTSYADAPTLTANQTVANLSALTDQTDATVATQANVTQTKASTTFTVASLPNNSTSIVLADCVINFSNAGDDADSLNCNSGVSTISRTTATGGAGTPRTATQIATQMRLLTSLHDHIKHGDLAASGSGTTVVFTTAGAEISNSIIDIANNTSGAITTGTIVTGVVAVAQINTVTIGGTPEAGDIYTMTVPAGTVSYSVLSSDTTTTNIANGIGAALVATSTYSAAAYTVATSTNTVVFTAKTAGTGFTQSSATTNRTPIAEQVTFTPALNNIYGVFIFGIGINSNTYSYTQDTLANTLAGLVAQLASDPAVTCTQDGTAVTCVAKVPGTAFTYSTSVIQRADSTGGGSSGGGSSGGSSGGGSSSHASVSTSQTTTTSTSMQTTLTQLQAQLASLMAQAKAQGMTVSANTSFVRDLTVGSTGADVQALQVWLNTHGFVIATSGPGSLGHESMSFGALTRAAVAKFQIAHGITPASGYLGPKTRAALK
jgi:hypothetical protein